MNRRTFFKKLGIGAATIAVAPKLLTNENLNSSITVNKNSREATRKLMKEFRVDLAMGPHDKALDEALTKLRINHNRQREIMAAKVFNNAFTIKY